MKLITFAVPSYNSQAYLHTCIDTLVLGGNDVEVIIVNDGSTDSTKQIADEYVSKYPDIVRAIHKQNGGHGSGVNAGLANANGLYFKVVDSDDWVEEDALKTLISTIKQHIEQGTSPDLYITNFVYEHTADNTSFTRSYAKNLKANDFNSWQNVKGFSFSNVMLMHALMYKTQVLRDSNTVLPEHTFYVDNIFAYQPLPYTKTIYFLDVNLYRYFIGRADQSVNIEQFKKRYQQQMRVMRHMVDAHSYDFIKKQPKGLKKYLWHALRVCMVITILFTVADYSKERKKDLAELWRYIKNKDKKMYYHLRYRSYPSIVGVMPFRLRGKVMVFGYKQMCKKIKFG